MKNLRTWDRPETWAITGATLLATVAILAAAVLASSCSLGEAAKSVAADVRGTSDNLRAIIEKLSGLLASMQEVMRVLLELLRGGGPAPTTPGGGVDPVVVGGGAAGALALVQGFLAYRRAGVAHARIDKTKGEVDELWDETHKPKPAP
jgi:hypothetical protein